ncbi:MAG: PilZ domain-containing protein [Gemmatimonadaceae bacterium]
MAKRGSEKREHPRVEARLAMQLAEETLGEALVTTESLNISRGGVYCESSEYLAPLSKVALTVILPAFVKGGRTSMLRTEGVVVRCEALPALRGRKRYQLACCFTGLDADARALLDQFVSWRALRGRAAALARAAAGSGVLRKVAKRAKKVVRKKVVKKAVAKKAARPAVKRAAPKKAARRSTPKKK